MGETDDDVGAYPMVVYVTLVSIASVIFVGGSSTRGPKGTYTVPEAGGVRMGLFTIVLTLISLPMTIIINRYVSLFLHSQTSVDHDPCVDPSSHPIASHTILKHLSKSFFLPSSSPNHIDYTSLQVYWPPPPFTPSASLCSLAR